MTTLSVDNFETPGGSEVMRKTMRDLHKTIAYYLREGNLADLQEWNLEEFAAAVYLLTILAERSPLHLYVTVSEVQRWRELYFPMYDARYHYTPDGPASNELRANILDAFMRLEAVAALHPKQWWEGD